MHCRFFSVLLQLELKPDLTGITVIKKEFKNIGSSNIIGIQQFEPNSSHLLKSRTNSPHPYKNSSHFIIMFAEGPPRFFDLESESFRVEPFEFSGCSSLDFKAQSCHGLARSRHGFIFALLQNGSLDHSRPKGKVCAKMCRVQEFRA